MTIPESDLKLLEAYLDDALSPTDVQRLDSRLNDEVLLADAFNAMRSERAARVMAFQADGPTQHQAQAFAENFIASIHRRQRRARVGGWIRIAGGIAACIIVGFAIGRLGRGGSTAPSNIAHHTPASIAPVVAHGHGDAHLVIHSPRPPEAGQYQVAVLDSEGNVIALQQFGKLEDARQFADDLGQLEARRQQVQESQAMLVSDRF